MSRSGFEPATDQRFRNTSFHEANQHPTRKRKLLTLTFIAEPLRGLKPGSRALSDLFVAPRGEISAVSNLGDRGPVNAAFLGEIAPRGDIKLPEGVLVRVGKDRVGIAEFGLAFSEISLISSAYNSERK